jgi:hypothetical protein
MWRALIPFLRFAFDCCLGLGAFTLIASLVCGLWASLHLGTITGSGHFLASTHVSFTSVTKPPNLPGVPRL